MLSRLRSSPPTVTPSDICIWPISRAVHLTQGGPITAKDLVSLIQRWPRIPIQLPFKSITEESITCPKGAARGAWLSGEAALCERASGSAWRVEVTKSRAQWPAVTSSESGGSSGAGKAASMPREEPGEAQENPQSKQSLLLPVRSECHAVLASLHCQGKSGLQGGGAPPSAILVQTFASASVQGKYRYREPSPFEPQYHQVLDRKQLCLQLNRSRILSGVWIICSVTQRQGEETLVYVRYLPRFL